MLVNTTEYRRQCGNQDESWLLQERQKNRQMFALASWTAGLGFAFAPFTFGLSLSLAGALVAIIPHIKIKLEIVQEELQERYSYSLSLPAVGAAKGLSVSVVPSNQPNLERRSQDDFEETPSTSDISPWIWLVLPPLVSITIFCVVIFLGSSFEAFVFYLILTLVTIPVVNGFLGDPVSLVSKGLFGALSSFSIEARGPTGTVRIRWTCKCGMRLYDDYQELETGAASDLLRQLSGEVIVGTRQKYISQGEDGKAASSATNTPPGQSEPPLQSVDAQFVKPQKAKTSQQPSASINPPETADINELSLQRTATRELYLLSCIDQGRYSTILTHIDVKRIKSDYELMLKVKDVVNQHFQLPAWLRLRTVSSINFINFELHRKQLVDIRKGDDVPPESRKDEYEYVPMPAKLIPPIGRNYLMHIYYYPEDADNYTLCLDRFPKRKTGRLQHTAGRPVPGWGIHFASGLDRTKVCIVGLFCTLCSASFGITWSVVRNDVQGGFGVSAYMMALLVFGVGSIQAVAM